RVDLDAILLCALQKEPSLRYSSVAEFTHDIRCHLAGKPVHARGNRAGYRVKTALFHDRRVQIASVVAVLCLIGLGLGGVFRSPLSKLPFLGTGSGAPAGDKTSIAVLPFDSLTADEENSYFADGVQEAILTNLAN